VERETRLELATSSLEG